jgi:starch synthase
LPSSLRNTLDKELSRRTWQIDSSGVIRMHASQEIIRVVLSRLGLSRYLETQQYRLVDKMFLTIDEHAARYHMNNINIVYAYEDQAATTFQVAKERGIRCFYDLPIMFYRSAWQIQAEEAQLFPELRPSLTAVAEPMWKLERKEEEIRLADHIFVASSVTQTSLLEAGVVTEKISVIPYGAPVDYFNYSPKSDRQFRAIFVGRLSPRKGVHYLFDAWHSLKLPDAELLLVGSNLFPNGWLERRLTNCRYVPSVPHQLLNQYYSSGNVFVFPSLVEGFGLVLLEAMACGLPVITTPNTAGPDIITDGVEGFIVPIRDVDALKEKLEWCYQHPQELAEMGKAARRKAEQLSWDLYRQRLASRVLEVYQQLA